MKNLLAIILFLQTSRLVSTEIIDETYFAPTIYVFIPVCNKAHWLPFTLACLEKINYPKDRITVQFYSDNNLDHSNSLISQWQQKNQKYYHHIGANMNFTKPAKRITWENVERHRHVLSVRQYGLEKARQAWADFFILLDADILLTDTETFWSLILKVFINFFLCYGSTIIIYLFFLYIYKI